MLKFSCQIPYKYNQLNYNLNSKLRIQKIDIITKIYKKGVSLISYKNYIYIF